MSERESRAVVMDTATGGIVAGGMPLRLGDLPAGTMLEREVREVFTGPADGFRHFEPGAITLKAAG